VNQSQFKSGLPLTTIAAETVVAVRNDRYKLVRNTVQVYNSGTDTGGPVTADEFYQIDQAAPTPKIDTADLNLMTTQSTWSAVIRTNYDRLLVSLTNILNSQPPCPGDANMDGVVDGYDISVWERFVRWAKSSVADFNFDGLTNNTDLQTIGANRGACAKSTSVY
jgi:hypothetical protein